MQISAFDMNTNANNSLSSEDTVSVLDTENLIENYELWLSLSPTLDNCSHSVVSFPPLCCLQNRYQTSRRGSHFVPKELNMEELQTDF